MQVVSMARFGQKQQSVWGLDEGQMGERAASGGLGEALCDAQRTAVGPGCSPEKTVRRRG
jgi:hypothetical protein